MWVNHHAMLRRLGSIDDAVVLMNLLLLLCIVALPFTTSLFATYLDRGAGSHLAAVVYAGSFLVTSSVFFALQCLLVLVRPQLLREALAPRQRRAILLRGAVALPVYLLAGLVGLLSAYATLGICVVMGAFYFLPRGSAEGPSGKDA
jgi:uncharacterized membrane protein